MPCLILLARSIVNRFNLVMQMNLFMMITHMSSYLCKLARNIKRTKPFRFKVYEKVKKKENKKKKSSQTQLDKIVFSTNWKLILCLTVLELRSLRIMQKNSNNLLFHQRCFRVRQPRLPVPMTFLEKKYYTCLVRI